MLNQWSNYIMETSLPYLYTFLHNMLLRISLIFTTFNSHCCGSKPHLQQGRVTLTRPRKRCIFAPQQWGLNVVKMRLILRSMLCIYVVMKFAVTVSLEYEGCVACPARDRQTIANDAPPLPTLTSSFQTPPPPLLTIKTTFHWHYHLSSTFQNIHLPSTSITSTSTYVHPPLHVLPCLSTSLSFHSFPPTASSSPPLLWTLQHIISKLIEAGSFTLAWTFDIKKKWKRDCYYYITLYKCIETYSTYFCHLFRDTNNRFVVCV